MWSVGWINAVCAVLCEQHACCTPVPVPRTAPRLSHEQFYYASWFCCCLINLCETDFLLRWTIRAACTSSSHVVHVAAPRVHDPLELCHVIGVKIWVNICPPSFLIVRPRRKLLRPVPSAVLSIRTFYASITGLLWNINCRRTDLTCQRSLFVEPRAWRFDSDNINDGIFIYSNTFIVWTFELSAFSLKKPKKPSSSSSRNHLCSSDSST